MRRSTKLLLVAVAILLVGGLLVYFGVRDTDEPVAEPDETPAAEPAEPDDPDAGPAPEPPTRAEVPEGMEGVKVGLSAVPGLAGYARAGDHISIYGVIESRVDDGEAVGDLEPPLAQRVIARALVLDVEGVRVTTEDDDAAEDAGSSSTYLIAVDQADAEGLIFLASFEDLWFTLLPEDETPGTTDGTTYDDVLP